MKTLQRKPLLFQVDALNREKDIVERHKFVIQSPIAGAFKVTNGEFFCDVTINEIGVKLKCTDKFGRIRVLKTEYL